MQAAGLEFEQEIEAPTCPGVGWKSSLRPRPLTHSDRAAVEGRPDPSLSLLSDAMNPLLPLSLMVGTVCAVLAVWALISGEAMVQPTYIARRADDPGFYWMAIAARVGGCIMGFTKAISMAVLAVPPIPT